MSIGKWLKRGRNLLIALVLCLSMTTAITAEAATTTQKEACKQELLKIYYSEDTSSHNISRYLLTGEEFCQICTELYAGEGRIIMGAYLPSTCFKYSTSWGIVRNINLINTGTGALERYEKMTANIQKILEGIEPEMTDLDKVLYLHDSLVEMASYGGNGDQKYMAGGALGEKKAVCSGYAKALNVLLSEVGLETDYVKASTIDHGWSYIKLDGEWYHIDPTWDDTRSPKTGKTSRTYLLLNDTEMSRSHGASTPKTIEEASDSQKYSDWFVHDIVGKMCYEGGMWYYVDNSGDNIMRSDIEGNVQEIVADCSGVNSVELVDVNGDKITINVDGSLQVITEGTVVESTNSTSIESEIPALSAVNLSDFSNWRSGMYHYQNGKYVTYDTRICLNSYVSCEANTEYQVKVSDSAYQVLIREMDANMNMLVSNNLKNGSSFVTNTKTRYVAISLYKPSNESTKFADYEKLFADGFTVEVVTDTVEENTADTEQSETTEGNNTDIDTTEEQITDSDINADAAEGHETDNIGFQLETIDFTDFNNWRTGIYSWVDGKYMEYEQRICLTDYVTFNGNSYRAVISNPVFKILVREMDANGKFIKTTTLTNGKTFVPGENTVSLGICLYRDAEKDLTYESYREMFQSGFYAKIVTE